MKEIKITARTPVKTIKKILMNCETENNVSNTLVKNFYTIFTFETDMTVIEKFRKYFVKNVDCRQYYDASGNFTLCFLLDFSDMNENCKKEINNYANELLENSKSF